jgi:hypothetical protein
MDSSLPNPAADGRLGAPVFAGDGPGRSGKERLTDGTAYLNFGPRLGLAWSITKRLVLRTVYGISYYPTGALGGGNAKPPATGFIANPTFFSQDQGLASGFNSTSARDQYNRGLEKALAQYEIPDRAVIAFNYELPIGPGKPIANVTGAIGKVTGGWQVNGILSYQSGEPIGVGINNTLPLFNSRNLPNVVPGVNPVNSFDHFDPATDVYLNINAFSTPAPFTFGNAASILPNARTFNSYNEDFGLMKRTSIAETVNIEFRFGMFNAFNRVRFGSPAVNVSDAFTAKSRRR